MGLHKTLERQLQKSGLDYNTLPENIKGLVLSVSDAYTHSDESYSLLERSLELSSKELEAKVEEARHAKELEQLNNFMVGRELKMVELKEEVKKLKEENDELRRNIVK